MDAPLIDLPSLPEPPEDFRQQVSNLSGSIADLRVSAQRLARYRLDGNQLHLLGNAVAEFTTDEIDLVGRLIAAARSKAAEDSHCADRYQANARAEFRGAANDLDSYFRTLKMRATWGHETEWAPV